MSREHDKALHNANVRTRELLIEIGRAAVSYIDARDEARRRCDDEHEDLADDLFGEMEVAVKALRDHTSASPRSVDAIGRSR